MTQMLSNVEQAVSDAADALLHAERTREAAQAALRAAEAEVEEASQVLNRLRRLRASLVGEDTGG